MKFAGPADEFCGHPLAGSDVLRLATRLLSFDPTLKAIAVAEGIEVFPTLNGADKALLARLKR